MTSAVGNVFDQSWLDGVEERKIRTKLGLINIRIGGTADGPVMLFWPSLMMDGTMWRYQYEHFKDRYRIILWDSPGHGKSDALRKIIDLKDSSDILVEVLDVLGIEKIVLVGNSWGAMLGGVFPAYYPERTLAVAAFNATASLPTSFESVWATAFAGALQLYQKFPQWAQDRVQSAFAGPTAYATRPEFMEFIKFPLYFDDPKSVSWAIRSILIGRRDEHSLLNTITDTPMMIVAGEEDSQFPVHVVRRMADAIQHSRFEIIKYSGHLVARENPGPVNALIDDFLRSHSI